MKKLGVRELIRKLGAREFIRRIICNIAIMSCFFDMRVVDIHRIDMGIYACEYSY